jgi:uncharacterized membrane protein (UPF0127 family)
MVLTLVGRDGRVLCARCRLADTPLARVKGLLGRRELAKDEGLLLATGAIHTSFMRFPIDVAFLDRNFVVLRLIRSLKPWRIAWVRNAHAVVELPAGALQRVGLDVGEQMSLVRHVPASVEAPQRRDAEADETLRVAVASADSRFLRVAHFLLSRHAFDVETSRDARSLMKAQRQWDVVVLDSSASLATAARVMRELSVVNPATGFVIVGDASPDDDTEGAAPQALRVFPKWESFDRLVDEILMASVSGRQAAGG